MSSLIIMFILAFIGVPLAFAISGSAIITLFITDKLLYLKMIPNTLFQSLNSFPYLAVPCFILAGNLMNKCQITNVLIDFCKKLVGHFRGGLAYVNVLASILFAGISGSAIADTSALGAVEIPMMIEGGYSKEFSAAVTVSSSVIGPIIPPSIIMVIYALVAGNVSIGAMFIAGFLPGLLMALSISVNIFFSAKKNKFPKSKRSSVKEILMAFWKAFPALLMPLIIIGGILGGIFTATEAAVVAVVYAIFVGLFIMRTLKLKDLPSILLESSQTVGVVCIIVAVAKVLAWVLTEAKVPQAISQFLIGYSTGPVLFIFIILILFVLMGCVFDPAAAIILSIPILLPVAMEMGFHPLHFGIFCSVAINLAVITPPVGACLYVACGLTGLSLEKLSYAVLPFAILLIIATALIGLFPDLVLFLPRLLGFA